ncbi:hypothetical protein FA13DRAFT_1705470 [Coprinellus micaceus]|uniref:Uncharacterized protein n=1 Tax=Coprinellus micaceus TaxID=71717 RepID=A0A4Y7TSM4_COPMI|nr:hypothetical protein FA13DRAFT_1705470 [Coprinellus micaceus]
MNVHVWFRNVSIFRGHSYTRLLDKTTRPGATLSNVGHPSWMDGDTRPWSYHRDNGKQATTPAVAPSELGSVDNQNYTNRKDSEAHSDAKQGHVLSEPESGIVRRLMPEDLCHVENPADSLDGLDSLNGLDSGVGLDSGDGLDGGDGLANLDNLDKPEYDLNDGDKSDVFGRRDPCMLKPTVRVPCRRVTVFPSDSSSLGLGGHAALIYFERFRLMGISTEAARAPFSFKEINDRSSNLKGIHEPNCCNRTSRPRSDGFSPLVPPKIVPNHSLESKFGTDISTAVSGHTHHPEITKGSLPLAAVETHRHEDARATIQGAHLPAVSPRPGALEASVEALKKCVEPLAQTAEITPSPTTRRLSIGAASHGVWDELASSSPTQLASISGVHLQAPMEGVVRTPPIRRYGDGRPQVGYTEFPGNRGHSKEELMAVDTSASEDPPYDPPRNGVSRTPVMPGHWRTGDESPFSISVGNVRGELDASSESIDHNQQVGSHYTVTLPRTSTRSPVEQHGLAGERATGVTPVASMAALHHDLGIPLPAQRPVSPTTSRAARPRPGEDTPSAHVPSRMLGSKENPELYRLGSQTTGSPPEREANLPPHPGEELPDNHGASINEEGTRSGKTPRRKALKERGRFSKAYLAIATSPMESEEDEPVPVPPFNPPLRSIHVNSKPLVFPASSSDEEELVRTLSFKTLLGRASPQLDSDETEVVQAQPINSPIRRLPGETIVGTASSGSDQEELAPALPAKSPLERIVASRGYSSIAEPSRPSSVVDKSRHDQDHEPQPNLDARSVSQRGFPMAGRTTHLAPKSMSVVSRPTFLSDQFPSKDKAMKDPMEDDDISNPSESSEGEERGREWGTAESGENTDDYSWDYWRRQDDHLNGYEPQQRKGHFEKKDRTNLVTHKPPAPPAPKLPGPMEGDSGDKDLLAMFSGRRQQVPLLVKSAAGTPTSRETFSLEAMDSAIPISSGPKEILHQVRSGHPRAVPNTGIDTRLGVASTIGAPQKLLRREVATALGQDVKVTIKQSVYVGTVWQWATVGGGVRGPLTVVEGGVVLCLYDTSEYCDRVRNAVTSWNHSIIEDFAPKFCLRNPQYTKEEAIDHFKTHLKHLKRSFRRYLEGTIDTDGHDSKVLANARQRRINRFFRRLRICERYKDAFVLMMLLYMILLSKMNWRGCSGDEMDEEELCEVTKKPRHLITTLDWRARSIRELMRKIDALDIFDRFVDGDRAIAGKFPEPRYDPRDFQGTKARTISESFNNGYLKGLPRNFYDDKWFHSLEPHEKESLDYQKPIDLTLPDALESKAQRGMTVKDRNTPPAAASAVAPRRWD